MTKVLILILSLLTVLLALVLTETNSELEGARTELSSVTNERNSLILERNVLQRNLESTQSDLDAANRQLGETRADLRETRAQVRATRNELEVVRQEKIRLNQQYELTTAPASLTDGGGLSLPNALLLFLNSVPYEIGVAEDQDEQLHIASDSLDMIEGEWFVTYTTIEDDEREGVEPDEEIDFDIVASPDRCLRRLLWIDVGAFRLTCEATVTWTIVHEDPPYSLTIMTQEDSDKVWDWISGRFEEENSEPEDSTG